MNNKELEEKVVYKDVGSRAISSVSWNIWSKDISIIYSFDNKEGLVINEFNNSASDRPVQYNNGAYCIIPINYEEKKVWKLESAKASRNSYGGRPVVKLEVTISTMNLRLNFYAVAFPGTSVIRQWFEAENTCVSSKMEYSVRPLSMMFFIDDIKDTYRATWFAGGKAKYDNGFIQGEALGVQASIHLHSNKTRDYVPMLLVMREDTPKDGFMVAMDYCGIWELNIKRKFGPVHIEYNVEEGKPLVLEPGEIFELPIITFATFKESFDNLMKTIYDWQYTFLWDYTNTDYFAKTRYPVQWVYNNRNLHEQFTYRIACLDLEMALCCQEVGYDMLWDDAGWSAYPGWPPDSYGTVLMNIYEGPDFRLAQRFFDKCGIGWCLWFAGNPTIGLLESKEGAWGSYEWRTDGVSIKGLREEKKYKSGIRDFLERNPECSFHTCDGGSRYSHTFDIQRYANYNYIADAGAGPYGNYYFSYFELPERWGDILAWSGEKSFHNDGSSIHPLERKDIGPRKKEDIKYAPEFARSRLAMVPLSGPTFFPDDIEASRKDIEIYNYLLDQGVAGRWSYMFHPEVKGDQEFYYMQRTSKDLMRACIILRHTPKGLVTIYPKNLIKDEQYNISFQNNHKLITSVGSEIMEHGIDMKDVQDGELIYINLPYRPGTGTDEILPEAPGMVLCCIENNIGHIGIGIYWSPGKDNNWISYYEIARNEVIVGRVSKGCYFFDYSNGWDIDADYTIRTVDGDKNCSIWCKAQIIRTNSIKISALGGHFSDIGRDGWSTEISTDLKNFIPMKWIPPVNNPSADNNGTPNQQGGVEGYWEGGTCARAGRGWQQASPDVFCVRKYKVLYDGIVRISGRAIKEWYHQDKGCDINVCILQNSCCIWPEKGWAEVKLNDVYGASHDIRVQVNKGDEIRFVVDKSTDGDEDLFPWLKRINLIGWIPRIVYENQNNNIENKDAIKLMDSMRINCGSDSAINDCYGNEWEADRFFKGGSSKLFDNIETSSNIDMSIISSGRVGDEIIYNIPVNPGIYSLRLCFADLMYRWNDECIMDIEINGDCVTQGLDVTSFTKEKYKKLDKLYNHIVPNAEGKIQVRIKSYKGEAFIQAIEVAPQLKETVRINCGSKSTFVDWAGFVWEADQNYKGGDPIKAEGDIMQVTPTLYDKHLYLIGRSGRHIEYQVPVKPGIYSVHLKFAELWLEEKGKRHMNISLNNQVVKKRWDPAFAAERVRMAFDLRFEGVSPVDGVIKLNIDAIGEYPAVIQAIELE